MRVLYFMNHVDQGGAALALYDLIVELKKNYSDYYPIVITGKKNKLNVMFDEIGVENYYADFKNFMSSYKEPFFITKAALTIRYEIGKRKGIKQIEDFIDFSKIDIIHTNLNRIDIGAILAEKHGVPHLWHIREHADIYSGVLQPHLVTEEPETKSFDLITIRDNPIKYMSDFDLISERQNYFIAISESVMREWIKKGIPENRIQLIYDGVRTELYNAVTDNEIINNNNSNNEIKMVFLGGYCKEKGQKELIEALLQLDSTEQANVHVDFYGNGEQEYINHIRTLAKPLIENGVICINSYDPEINSKLSNYDVGINCSSAEGFGRVIVEYMMAGLCPLVSNTGASPEIVTDMHDGIMYKKNSVSDLREKIQFLVNNPNYAKKYGRLAREKSLVKFSMSRHAGLIYELYKKILEDRR